MSSQASIHPVIFRLSICSASHASFFIFFLVPCFNFKVQREKELFVLNCPPHDSKLSEIDYDDKSEKEQHRNNNFLQTFCQINVKSWRFRKSEYAKAEVPLSKNLRRGNQGFRRSGGSAFAVTLRQILEFPQKWNFHFRFGGLLVWIPGWIRISTVSWQFFAPFPLLHLRWQVTAMCMRVCTCECVTVADAAIETLHLRRGSLPLGML